MGDLLLYGKSACKQEGETGCVWRHYVQAGEVWGARVWNGIRCINIGNDSAILFQENEVIKSRFNI